MLLSLSFFWIIKLNVLGDATTKTKLSNCIERWVNTLNNENRYKINQQ